MSSSVKEKEKLGREDAARRIAYVVHQLEEGALRFGDREFPVPEHVRFEIKANEGELEIELKWRPAEARAKSGEREPALTS